jgi:hypothetical protein
MSKGRFARILGAFSADPELRFLPAPYEENHVIYANKFV